VQARALALMVEGRVIYETMEEYWPWAREDASLPDYMAFARRVAGATNRKMSPG
jgi:hypothetical protein